MEKLKLLGEVLEPDDRSRLSGTSLESLHRFAAEATLNASVPELVQNQFAMARNAYLYSRFFYPFRAVAFLYSILAIELALQLRVKSAHPDLFAGGREATLYPLLERALKERWILDSGFKNIDPDVEIAKKIAKRYPGIPDDQRSCYSLLDALVSLRNDLAHGKFMIAPAMSTLVARGTEIINQLYPEPSVRTT
jgi:hypothetical protein